MARELPPSCSKRVGRMPGSMSLHASSASAVMQTARADPARARRRAAARRARCGQRGWRMRLRAVHGVGHTCGGGGHARAGQRRPAGRRVARAGRRACVRRRAGRRGAPGAALFGRARGGRARVVRGLRAGWRARGDAGCRPAAAGGARGVLAARLFCWQRCTGDTARALCRLPRCCMSWASTTGAPACVPFAATACSHPIMLSCTRKTHGVCLRRPRAATGQRATRRPQNQMWALARLGSCPCPCLR